MKGYTPEEVRRAYQRAWYKANREKVRKYHERYWKRKAAALSQEKEAKQSDTESNPAD